MPPPELRLAQERAARAYRHQGPPRAQPQRSGFFDLTSDPKERKPIAIREGQAGAAQLSRLLELQSEFEALGAGSVRNAEPTEAEQALIRELGYAE